MSLTYRRSRKWIATGAAAIAALSLASSANAAAPGGLDIPGTVLRSGDFNTGGLSQWSGHQRVSSAYSLQVLPGTVREGSHAARFEVRQGDDPLCQAGWGCYGDRSEVQMSTGEVEGQERWYSWSTMFASDFPSYTNWQVFSQWHSKKDGAPPLAFYVSGDNLVLQANRNDGTNFLSYDKLWTGPMRRGQWQDIRLHVKWSGSDSVGFVELWIDGVPQTLTNGSTRRYVRTMYPGYGNYFKQGYYRQSGLSAPGVVYHDGFRMSDGQGAMSSPPPPSSSPTPPPPSSTPAPAVTVTPSSASVATGTTKQFTAAVSNTTGGVSWSVNGVAGGNATVGTVSSAGLYRAPAAVPTGGTVTVKATSTARPTASATATVTVTDGAAAPAPAPAPVSGATFFSDGFETASPAAAGSPWTLRLDGGNRFAWSTLHAASGARSSAFAQVADAGNVAYITRAIPSGQGDVSVTARVYLRSNTLANGRARSLMRVVRGDGRVAGPRHEMGIMRTASGQLRWAVWSADRDGRYSAATLGTQAPVLGRWTTVTLRTQWNRADARPRLGIAGGEAFSGAAVDLAGTTPSHVDVGSVRARSSDPGIVYFDEVTVTDAASAATTASRARSARVKVPGTSRAPKRRAARR